MLEHTFIHLSSFGPRRERRLWSSGISSWNDFLERFGSSPYHQGYCRDIASSNYALKLGDGDYFARVLPSSETWRTFPHFKRIAYLDIETTGLAPETDYATVVGVYDGEKTHSYIHGINLDTFAKDIQKYDLVVTFNGSIFDLPFLRKNIPGIRMPNLHIDLRFLLASVGVRGGLKKIEEHFGISREDDLKGLNGYDAVLMWKAYLKGDKAALDRLVRYNSADICNLKVLTEWAYNEKRKHTGFDEICIANKISGVN